MRPPDKKLLLFRENPVNKGIFDLDNKNEFSKFQYFRLETPKAEYLIRQGVKYVLESWENSKKTLHTGLIPIGINNCYYADHLEMKGERKIHSLMIIFIDIEKGITKILYFNHYSKKSTNMSINFCRNYVNELA